MERGSDSFPAGSLGKWVSGVHVVISHGDNDLVNVY